MAEKEKTPQRVWVRVTVGMAGVRRGQFVLVDPSNPDIALLIASSALVLLGDDDGN